MELTEAETPTGLEALPAWLRFICADVVVQVLEGERAVLVATRRTAVLETSPEGRQIAERQSRDQQRHVAFFVDTRRRLGIDRPVNPHLRELLCDASTVNTLPALLVGTHLVLETLGSQVFNASSALLTSQCANPFFSMATRCTLGELATAFEQLQRDETRHVAHGLARLREERSKLGPEQRRQLDAEIAAWRVRFVTLFARLPLLTLLRPWLELRSEAVLAQFDARARAVLAA